MSQLFVETPEQYNGALTSYVVKDGDGTVVRMIVIGSQIELRLDPDGASRLILLQLSRDEAYALAVACSAIVHDDRSRGSLTEEERAKATAQSDALGLLRLHGEVMAS